MIKEAKRKCYPENIKISENEAAVPLMDHFIHTAPSLTQIQDNVNRKTAILLKFIINGA